MKRILVVLTAAVVIAKYRQHMRTELMRWVYAEIVTTLPEYPR